MKRMLPAIVAAFALHLSGHAEASDQPDGRPSAGAAASGDASIIVTINPEDRVAVALAGALPGPAPRGTPVDFKIKIVNQGFATGLLLAHLVDPPQGAVLDFHPQRLTGSPQELRTLRIMLKNSAPADLTIAFRLSNEMPDLGGRDRIHLLIRPL
jgi:hypothetical protein